MLGKRRFSLTDIEAGDKILLLREKKFVEGDMTMKTILNTDKAPKAIGPYSQGINTGNLMFLSGQLPILPSEGKIVAHDIEGQTKQSLENVKSIL